MDDGDHGHLSQREPIIRLWVQMKNKNVNSELLVKGVVALSLLASVVPTIIVVKGWWFDATTWFTPFNIASIIWLILTVTAIILSTPPKRHLWLLFLFPLAFWPLLFGLWFGIAIRLGGFAP